MQRLFTFLILISGFSIVKAQTKPTENVEGHVTAFQKPVEGATVSLLRFKDSAVLKHTATDNSGKFAFSEDQNGKYLVSVQLVGFKTYYSEIFEVTASSKVEIQPVALLQENQQLNSVTVSSKKNFIEQKLDKTIVNVEASPTNVGLSALEVLEKSPGVTVDKDGNVSLKGKQGVLILLDGKPHLSQRTGFSQSFKKYAQL